MNVTSRAICGDTWATTYRFGPHTYTHVGQWPPVFQPGVFTVPFLKVVTSDGQDITRQVKEFAGPRHIVTPEVISYALGTWRYIPRVYFYGFCIRFTWIRRLVPLQNCTEVTVTNILCQSETFGAK